VKYEVSLLKLNITVNARTLTLSDLRQRFGVRLNASDRCFDGWLVEVPPVSETEALALERIRQNLECKNKLFCIKWLFQSLIIVGASKHNSPNQHFPTLLNQDQVQLDY